MPDNELTLEKLRISERLTTLETIIKNDRVNQSRILTDMEEIIKRHDKTLHGAYGNNGLTTKVKVLEEKDKTRKWHLSFLWAGMSAALGKFLIDLFHIKNGG